MPDYRASWYSQLPAFGWFDREDRPGSNALGVPDWQQGIALPSRRTLGQYFNVTGPGGQTYRLQQTDVGPAPWTGRGVDISAAAAHSMGYTPKTFPTDARFTVEPTDGSAMPSSASLTSGNMPNNSLMDMLQQPQQQSFTDRLGGMSNSLIGLGMGMLQPYNPWAGTNAWTNALQGYQTGSALDQRSAAQRQQQAMDQARLRLAQAQFERGGESEFEKIQRDIQRYGPAAEKFYASRTEGDWALADIGQDQWGQPIKKWVNKRTMETRDVQPGDAVASNAPFTAGGAVPYVGAGPMATGTQPPSAPAPTPSAGARTPMVTLPDGSVVAIPPGTDAKTIRTHVAQQTADTLTGKYTGEQAKAQLFANRMEISKRILDQTDKTGTPIDVQGTSFIGGGIERMPGSDRLMFGNLLQSKDYQAYRQAKDSFINALLRNESGAAINTGEYVRIDREMFPQPGDSAKTVGAKRQLRDAALQGMIRSAGPGYRSPSTVSDQPQATSGGGASSPADALRQELIRRGVNPD